MNTHFSRLLFPATLTESFPEWSMAIQLISGIGVPQFTVRWFELLDQTDRAAVRNAPPSLTLLAVTFQGDDSWGKRSPG